MSINYEVDKWIGMRELLKICTPPDQDDDGFPRLLKWEKRGIDKDDFGGFSIKEKGIFVRKWDKLALSLLSEGEQEILRYGLTSSPSKPGKPVLKFPCSVSELRRFMEDEGLADAFSEESLAKLMAIRWQEGIEQADTTALIASDGQEKAGGPRVVSGDVSEQTDDAQSGASEESKPVVKHRTNKVRAILQNFIGAGVPSHIESIWLHIGSNAGREGFPFAAKSSDSAVHVDGERIKKANMARALSSLLNAHPKP